jgi:hypothetical protein
MGAYVLHNVPTLPACYQQQVSKGRQVERRWYIDLLIHPVLVRLFADCLRVASVAPAVASSSSERLSMSLMTTSSSSSCFGDILAAVIFTFKVILGGMARLYEEKD